MSQMLPLCRRLVFNRSFAGARSFPRKTNIESRHGVPSYQGLHTVPSRLNRLETASLSHQSNGEQCFSSLDTFARRHVGPSPHSAAKMLSCLDPPAKSLDGFVKEVIPSDILSSRNISIGAFSSVELHGQESSPGEQGFTESQLITRLQAIASQNKMLRSYIGCGYAGTRTPEVIKRNILEGPGWYTSYTPYQPEISQGRLESLLNFQTMVSDLTGLPISNGSLLDEPTAAAEAMTLSLNSMPTSRQKKDKKVYVVSSRCHPQTIAVLQSRAEGFGVQLKVTDVLHNDCQNVRDVGEHLVGVLVQYPDTYGHIHDFQNLSDAVHELGGTVSVATDLLALTVLRPPGEFGADVAFGNAQRFGVPFGYGGPHAAFFSCSEKNKRKIPGRLVGISKDRLGGRAIRLALQTREQHIRREKATSNICTAQVLLANMSAFFSVYHGPEGLKRIARRVIACTEVLATGVSEMGFELVRNETPEKQAIFDTVVVAVGNHNAHLILDWAVQEKGINLRIIDDEKIGVTLDETVEPQDLQDILDIFGKFSPRKEQIKIKDVVGQLDFSMENFFSDIPTSFRRQSSFMDHPVFNSHHSETELLRYIHHLQSKDLSLVHSMIPLGSCTMKLNATTEMIPVSWPSFSSLHPFVPSNQARGYATLIQELETDLAEITGFDKVSLQPNSGAQGEFTALRIIRKYLETKGGKVRDICLIPVSAHGTNPASATMAGMRVVTIKCDPSTGNLDIEDLKTKCEKYSEELGAIMVTYPSTFGVFEPQMKKVCEIVHSHGGQVFMDGANMNAQIGLCSPGEIGADACHLNLHKTFCIPHGGGGPGVGPVGVKAHLAPFLPGHPIIETGGEKAIAAISGAPWGSASILPISWAYIKMMGGPGLTHATKITLLNANYIMSRLRPHYEILYTNENKRCAHEFILDVRRFKSTSGIEAIDIAKRLQDYGFHAPTMSWPVANTLMIEPTESESQEELDRFCDALISIRGEIKAVEDGKQPRERNLLKMAPHTQRDLLTSEWTRSYSREEAAYPLAYLKEKKFWPTVTRLDDAYGDMNLFCSCGPVEEADAPVASNVT